MGHTTATCCIICLMLLLASNLGCAEDNPGGVIDLQNILLDVSATLTEQKREFNYFFQKLDQGENGTTERVILQNISDTLNLMYMEKKKPTCSIARDCSDIYLGGTHQSGIYRVRPTGWENIGSFDVYCDMDTDDGGWTVFQRRGNFGNPEDYFYRTWVEYRKGFGNMDKEFWIGNDRLSALTKQRKYQLRIDLQDHEQNKTYANFVSFEIANRKQLYKLTVSGYSGTAGDSLTQQNQMKFYTKDQDNVNKCAVKFKGAWWYNNCHRSNLNGLNLKGSTEVFAQGMSWHSLKGHYYSMTFSEMKIRPTDY